MGRTKILLPAAFMIGVLVWPAVGLAGAPTGMGGGAITAGNQPVPNLALPPMWPGATVKVVNWSDAQAWHGAPIFDFAGGIYYAVDPSAGTDVWANLDIPAGSHLARVDVYGYRASAGTLGWDIFDVDSVNGTQSILASGNSASGTGVIQTTLATFSSTTVATGHRLEVDLRNSADPGIGFVGAVYQYIPPSMTLYPITPIRVYDSRFSTKMLSGEKRTINVKNAIDPATGAVTAVDAIPQGARAISFTITLTQTVGAGNVAVLPGGSTTVTASTINWTTAGLDIASGSMVTFGTGTYERQVTLALGGPSNASSHVIVDVTGYYQ